MSNALPQRFEKVRHALVRLHKTLVDSERVTYEQTVGGVHSPGHFLQLLTSDPWFAWLHPLSQFIVSMDEALEAEEPLTIKVSEGFMKEVQVLLSPSETGEGFARHYFEALQRDPDVVLAHADVLKIVGKRKAPTEPRSY